MATLKSVAFFPKQSKHEAKLAKVHELHYYLASIKTSINLHKNKDCSFVLFFSGISTSRPTVR